MKHKLGAAQTLSLYEWAVLVQAWVVLLVLDLGLRLLPFPRVQKLAVPRRRAWDGAVALEIRRLERLVDIAARNHLYPMTCLRQALSLQWLLGQRGIDTHLQIGVRKESGVLKAHAWLECAGRVLGETSGVEVGFTPLVAVDLRS